MSSISNLKVEEMAQFAESGYLDWDDGACVLRSLADERDALRKALVEVHEDCIARATKNATGESIVPIGRTAWSMVCAALKGSTNEA